MRKERYLYEGHASSYCIRSYMFSSFFFFFFISLSTFLRVYSFLARFCTVPRGFSRAHRTKSDHSGFSRARIKRFPELTHHRISLNSIFFFFFNFKKKKSKKLFNIIFFSAEKSSGSYTQKKKEFNPNTFHAILLNVDDV